MLRKACLITLFLCITVNLKATSPSVKADSILKILKINDQTSREEKLIHYIKSIFVHDPITRLQVDKIEIDTLFRKYGIKSTAAYVYFIESICQQRVSHLNEAENALLRAIDLAGKDDDHYLLYNFFTHLAFLQIDQGNTIAAVSSYRRAKKETIILDDPFLEALIDINISDIYYKNDLHVQSLFYLNQVQDIITQYKLNEQGLKNLLYNNKSENYFRMNKIDSLKKYSDLLNGVKSGDHRLYTFKNRIDYYLCLLHHNYKNAIKRINILVKDTLYKFDNRDKQNLADAYYNAGNADSAKYIINQLLTDPAENNHPEIKYHLYEVLGQIAIKKNNFKEAAGNFKIALLQSKDQINRLTQVGNISSEIKIDEMKGSYVEQQETYKRERLGLISLSIAAALTVIIIAMFYWVAKQKRYYERVLFAAKKEELAFINSHEVRKHLSNILGIIDMIKHSENKEMDYLQAEDHLFRAAENLDKAIKSISEKLND